MVALYCLGFIPFYRGIIKFWGIYPFDFPFIDTDTVLSAIRCINRGVDVYAANPCDVLKRVYDYSPLWTVLSVFPMTRAWLSPIGMGVDIIFLLSLSLLPVGRSWRNTWWITAGIVSSATLFAMERGNNDLVLFVLAVGAATLVCRSDKWRLLGYGCALLAGLLKYYPMTLMLIATRERPGRFMAIAAASIITVAVFVIVTWHDLVRALSLIPTGSYFGDMFGSVTLGGGLTERLELPPVAVKIIRLVLSLLAIGIGVRLGVRSHERGVLTVLNERERAFLLVGALLVLSCFFTAQNIGYRAVHLILVLPALSVLRDTSNIRVFRYALPLAIGLLWSGAWYHDIVTISGAVVRHHGYNLAQIGAWLVREAMWWSLVILLVSCVADLILSSNTVSACLCYINRYNYKEKM
ncbi:hypothetical protein Geu3261_0123_002 [Komagataeibacter europaeus NBRC 3261]|uniref:DUF2029 domain-containing protein n=2 Tax=Komagataeibacter europaeus TaxID=33995 RepID=A0A0D6Q294_KOMEU|nr:hypothetical protein Geu3261_0123_002 [Komagataeibacter europaeus NBRC 3261]